MCTPSALASVAASVVEPGDTVPANITFPVQVLMQSMVMHICSWHQLYRMHAVLGYLSQVLQGKSPASACRAQPLGATAPRTGLSLPCSCSPPPNRLGNRLNPNSNPIIGFATKISRRPTSIPASCTLSNRWPRMDFTSSSTTTSALTRRRQPTPAYGLPCGRSCSATSCQTLLQRTA